MTYPAIRIGLLLVAVATSCGDSQPVSRPVTNGRSNPLERSQLGESLAQWMMLKAQNGGSYVYTSYAAFFSGHSTTTTIEVVQDRVARRSFENKDQAGVRISSWTETESALGSHREGEPALTVEAVYDRCTSEVLSKDPVENNIVLRAHENGLLYACLYVPKNCADDCAEGAVISTLAFTK